MIIIVLSFLRYRGLMNINLVSDKDFDHQIGILVSEMKYVRDQTFLLTQQIDLSIADLDYNFDSLSNSIGTLLLHIAAHEFKFQLNHFFKRPITKIEFEKYTGAMPHMMHKRLIKGNDFSFYKKELDGIRENTLKHLKKLNDVWLFEEFVTPNGKYLGNNYYLLRHVIDDEINHQGQIKIILKRLKNKKTD